MSRDEIRTKMKNKYLNNPEYNYEKVNRASLACGPMVKWAIALVSIWHMIEFLSSFYLNGEFISLIMLYRDLPISGVKIHITKRHI